MTEQRHKILIFTTTRADWGILAPLAGALAARNDCLVTVAAGNMHLMPQYGLTVNEIRNDGMERVINLDLPANPDEDTPLKRTEIVAATMTSAARVLKEERPDCAVILGDRYEMLGVAQAALLADVPIVHLHGGEVTQGAIDDSIRNAISMMATLHLTATEGAAARLRSMGIEGGKVCCTGSLGVHNALNINPLSRSQLSRHLDDFPIDERRTLLVTFHPVTNHPDNTPTLQQIDNLLDALDDNPRANAVVTYPNNDSEGTVILERLRQYAGRNPERIRLVESLGRQRYLSMMQYVRAVVGNTSSGILEAPSTPADTLDIGPRQQGRERARSVIHVDDSRQAISQAIKKLIDTPRQSHSAENNPYYRPDALQRAVDALTNFLKR